MLSISHLSRTFETNTGKVFALRDMSVELSINDDIYAFVGPNGAGKTTFFKILTGLLYPTAGQITIDGKALSKTWINKNIALVLAGDRALYQRNTVLENALYFSALKFIPKKMALRYIEEYSTILELEHLLHRQVEGLSSGQRKKAALLAGLCCDARLLLIDEPTWGLDIDAVASLQQCFKSLVQEKKISLFLSSHDVRFVSDIAQKFIFLREGRVVETIEHALQMDELLSIYQVCCEVKE